MSKDNRFSDWKIDIILGNYSQLPWLYEKSEVFIKENVTIHRSLKDLYLLHASADCVVCSGGYNSLIESMQGKVKNIFAFSVMDFHIEEEQVHNIRDLGKFYTLREITSLESMTDFVFSHMNSPSTMNGMKLNLNGINNATCLIINDMNTFSHCQIKAT